MTDLDFLQDPAAHDAAPRPRGFRLNLGSIMLLGALVVLALVVGLALARQQQGQPTAGPAPDFTVTSFDGTTYRLSDLRGQVVILNFWASWCGPCRVEAPVLEQLWRDYRDRGVLVLGVAFADNERDSVGFIEEFDMTYPNAPDIGTFISKELYHITGVPETFIIDRDGNIAQFIFASIDEQDSAQMRALIDSLLLEGDA